MRKGPIESLPPCLSFAGNFISQVGGSVRTSVLESSRVRHTGTTGGRLRVTGSSAPPAAPKNRSARRDLAAYRGLCRGQLRGGRSHGLVVVGFGDRKSHSKSQAGRKASVSHSISAAKLPSAVSPDNHRMRTVVLWFGNVPASWSKVETIASPTGESADPHPTDVMLD
jgi:hypothetical protein